MSARLGEMLMKVGALTGEQLEQVLNAQSIYGGRLGTNLVEMGLVDEAELVHVLSEQSGVPAVSPQELDAVPKPLLKLIPVEMVRRHRVLPLALDGRRLTVAMADPSDFKALDEIAFCTGFVIVPRVCSDLRLAIALERLCGIKRPMRYIPVAGGVRSRFSESLAVGDAAAYAGEKGWAWGEDVPAVERVSVQELARRLARASGEAEVIRSVMSYVAGEFDRGAFLRLKGDAVRGIQAVCEGKVLEGFSGFQAELAGSRGLKQVARDRRLYLGEVAPGEAEGALMEAIGADMSGPALLVPVCLGGEVAAVICANDRRGRLGGGVFELQRVAVMAELSCEMMALRKRIMAG